MICPIKQIIRKRFDFFLIFLIHHEMKFFNL